MLGSFAAISPHLKFKAKKISIDNLGFKFFYRGTFIILLVSTILVTSRQYIGEHIRCITGGTIPEHVINTFCFFTTTFTVMRHLNETLLQSGSLPHPGIGPMYEEEPIQHHAYYQWVPFVLFGKALLFYFPHYLWKLWEGGKIKKLVDGLQMITLSKYMHKNDDMHINSNYTVPSHTTIDGRIKTIKTEFLHHIKVNRFWANRLIFCEFLNIFNLLLQIYFTQRFLSGQFLTLGIEFLREDFSGKMDALDVVFPKVTKCHFYKYGPSGTIQKLDALCIMALNVINEKIFVFLWFWYGLMLFIGILCIAWRMLTLILHSRSNKFNGYVFSMASPGRLNPWDMLTITRHSSFSDWLFLYYIAKNMEPYLFSSMLISLANELEQIESNDDPDNDNNSILNDKNDATGNDDDDDDDDNEHDGSNENDKNHEMIKLMNEKYHKDT